MEINNDKEKNSSLKRKREDDEFEMIKEKKEENLLITVIKEEPHQEISTFIPQTTTVNSQTTNSQTTRCQECNKKLGIVKKMCKCEKYFCDSHFFFEKHNCSFDYRTKNAQELEKRNPVIIASKITSI